MSETRGFEQFHFAPGYEVAVDVEFPGNGDWGCEVFGFGRDGALDEPFHSTWGTPLVLEVKPNGGARWVGQYAAGGLGGSSGVSGVYACPSAEQVCVVVGGLAYLTRVDAPAATVSIGHEPVTQVVAVQGRPLLLLVGFVNMVAFGSDGLAWRTKRLAVDDLRVIRASDDEIECTLDNLGGTPTITLDAATGEQIDGTRLDSFWPPDALA